MKVRTIVMKKPIKVFKIDHDTTLGDILEFTSQFQECGPIILHIHNSIHITDRNIIGDIESKCDAIEVFFDERSGYFLCADELTSENYEETGEQDD